MARVSMLLLVLTTVLSSVAAFAPSTTSSSATGTARHAVVVGTTTMTNTRLFSTKENDATTTATEKTDAAAVGADDDDNNKNDPKAKMAAMMQPIKDAGVAGALSLFLWEAAFWILSVPACSIAYYQATGAWPDWSNTEDVAKVGAEAFAFANIARFALPLRVGLAISTTPWVQANLVDRFAKKEE